MQVLIVNDFGLKMPIYAPKNCGFGDMTNSEVYTTLRRDRNSIIGPYALLFRRKVV